MNLRKPGLRGHVFCAVASATLVRKGISLASGLESALMSAGHRRFRGQLRPNVTLAEVEPAPAAGPWLSVVAEGGAGEAGPPSGCARSAAGRPAR